MSSRDKDTKLLQDMLKVFFKKGSSAPLPARNELVVTVEMERELGADAPPHRRLRALKELSEKALVIRIPEEAVKKLWTCTRDLLDDPNIETRHAALSFFRNIVEGQGDDLVIMRTIFFHYLRDTHATHSPDDTQLRFKFLHTLTNSGKNIKCFEEQIGAFLLEWLPQIQAPAQIVEFLQLIINVVKFNATYLDEEIVHGIVNNACYLCEYSAEGGVVTSSLSLLEAVVSYSLLPREALPTFTAALCRTVNLEHYCQASWKLMRSVLGADIGHATLQQLVRTLRGDDAGPGGGGGAGGGAGEVDAGLMRGCVFYMSMALWGPRRVLTLQVSPLAVLPAMLQALEREQPVVTYEVSLALQSLVARAPHELTDPACDALLQLLDRVLHHDSQYPTTLHYTTLHYTTHWWARAHRPRLRRAAAAAGPRAAPRQSVSHHTTLHYTTLHYTTHWWARAHRPRLRRAAAAAGPRAAPRQSVSHHTTLHYTTLHYTLVGTSSPTPPATRCCSCWTACCTTTVSIPPHYTTLHYTTHWWARAHRPRLRRAAAAAGPRAAPRQSVSHHTTLHYTTLHTGGHELTDPACDALLQLLDRVLHHDSQYPTTLHYTTLHYTTHWWARAHRPRLRRAAAAAGPRAAPRQSVSHHTTLHYTTLHTGGHELTDPACDALLQLLDRVLHHDSQYPTTLHYTTLHYTLVGTSSPTPPATRCCSCWTACCTTTVSIPPHYTTLHYTTHWWARAHRPRLRRAAAAAGPRAAPRQSVSHHTTLHYTTLHTGGHELTDPACDALLQLLDRVLHHDSQYPTTLHYTRAVAAAAL
ncbi:hypothetical protein evm_013588 [Chilo suppressalis]|nr:hypothetical protein evm_013588 [Chilo suppressalis]